MTDLEITKLCAEAMGYQIRNDRSVGKDFVMVTGLFSGMWQPLHDDAQAMALVKRFYIEIECPSRSHGTWTASRSALPHPYARITDSDLNRAICECVAKMQEAKNVPSDSSSGR